MLSLTEIFGGNMNYADELAARARALTPQYQATMNTIEEAKQALGLLDDPYKFQAYPPDFDDKLMELIDSVPLE